MSKLKKFTWLLGLIVLCIFAILTWYKIHYSMDIAEPFTVTVPQAKYKLLIATQGSAYKNAVLKGLISAAKKRKMSLEVIDVSSLSTVDIDEWSVIVIIHTWENWQPQANALEFAQRHPNTDKILYLSTSGKGDLKIPNVDAITSASLLKDVPKHVSRVWVALTNRSRRWRWLIWRWAWRSCR